MRVRYGLILVVEKGIMVEYLQYSKTAISSQATTIQQLR